MSSTPSPNKSPSSNPSPYDDAVVKKGALKLKSGLVIKKSKNTHNKGSKPKSSKGSSLAQLPDTNHHTNLSSNPVPYAVTSKTPAQLKFELVQRKRQKDRISTIASKSHKEKVEEFNKYLECLSEHHDIPKVGPG